MAMQHEPTAPREPAPTTRAFSARRSLPNGRALVGALLITVAAVGAFAAAASGDGTPTSEYLVITDGVEAGDVITATDVRFEAMTLSADVAATALQSDTGLEGAIALRDLHAGTILDERDVRDTAIVDGAPLVSVHELTLPVPRDRAPSALRRGDRVTVLAFSGADETLRTALEDAVVLGFDSDPAGIGSSDEARLTLALADPGLVTNATLLSYESLTVVLTSRAIDDEYPTEVGNDDPPETPAPTEAPT
jgi:hypothetical protein